MPTGNQSGFHLVEVLVVAAIIVVALLGVVDQAASSIRGNRIADQQAVATALAQWKMEYLERFPYADSVLTPGSYTDASNPLNADSSTGGIYTRSWTVAYQTINTANDAKRISVAVTYPQMTGTASVTLTSLVANTDYGPSFPGVLQYSWS